MPSPIAKMKGPLTMDFFSALHAVMEGQKVTRLSWNDKTCYMLMFQDHLCHTRPNGSTEALLLRQVDLDAIDWVVVKEN